MNVFFGWQVKILILKYTLEYALQHIYMWHILFCYQAVSGIRDDGSRHDFPEGEKAGLRWKSI